MVKANLPAYFESWSDELRSRANRVRNLIGARHWLTDGVYKEVLIREFLLRHLPTDLRISKGFIRQLDRDDVSPEVDLMVTDPKRHVPIFNEGDFQIVSPSSVLATLEIKSTYSKAVLRDALNNVCRVRRIAGSPSEIWSGCFFVNSDDLSIRQLVDDASSILKDKDFWTEALQSETHPEASSLLPGMICAFDACTMFVQNEIQGKRTDIKAFQTRGLSAAFGFSQLFSFIRATLTDQYRPGELESAIEAYEGLDLHNASLTLPPL
jgi:hypothetical protein